jgi:hypothetical protein
MSPQPDEVLIALHPVIPRVRSGIASSKSPGNAHSPSWLPVFKTAPPTPLTGMTLWVG